MRTRAGRLFALGALAILTTAVVAGLAPLSPAGAQGPPRKGGELRVAMIGEPPSLDMQATTAVITREIGVNVFETLYTLDAKFQPVPHLAEGHEVADGGKRYTVRLRKGVRFHNGKEMTAADVVASLRRWGSLSSAGKATFKAVESVEARDAATVEIRLREPSAILLSGLAQIGSAAVIYPKEVVDAAGTAPLKEFVGTGPFRFVEHRPDVHIKLARFDGYAGRPEPPSGLAGQRAAHVDALYFLPVPDYATRQAGLQTFSGARDNLSLLIFDRADHDILHVEALSQEPGHILKHPVQIRG
jgi:peptide/nickel transport system substrate-binding protein